MIETRATLPRYSRLSPDQCEQLHEASLSILERTGVRLHGARGRRAPAPAPVPG